MLSSGKLALAEDTASVRARSLALFKESAAHYEAGRYSVAAALLEEAYALHPEPKLLYNLGRARESIGEVKGALEAYEAYLQHEPASDRSADVQQRIAKLRAKSEPAPAPAASESPEPTAEDTHSSPAPPSQQMQVAPTRERNPSRIIPWALVGSGGAVLAGALTLGLVARSGHRQAEQEPVQTKAVALQQTAERRALVANILAGAGGALAIAGGAWLVFGGRRGASKPEEEASDNLAWEVHLGPSRVHYTLSF